MISRNRFVQSVCWSIIVLGFISVTSACHSKPVPPVIFSLPAQQPVTYPYHFAIFSDSHASGRFNYFGLSQTNRIQGLIINKIAEANPDFVINDGDRVSNASLKSDWVKFDELNAIFRDRNISYYPVIGNHDLMGIKDAATGPPAVLNDYFKRFPYLEQRRWYDFQHGNTGFIMLDSNFSKLKPEELNQQIQWLGVTLAKYETDTAISFVIICLHHIIFSNSVQHKIDPVLQNTLLPVFEKSSKLKLVFSGHHHSYERFKIKNVNYIVCGGGGGRLYRELPPDQSRYHDEYINKPHGYHFCWLTISEDKIQLKTTHLDPKKLTWQDGDTLEIAK